jgi:vancomycin resistance protein VanJ
MQAKALRFFRGLRYGSAIIALLVITLPYWPQWLWLQWLSLIILYAPAWWYLALFMPWCIGWRSLSVWQELLLIPLVTGAFTLFDLNIPTFESITDSDFVTLSANLGNMGDGELLARLLQRHNVDIALLQEARPDKLTETEAAGWNTHCDAGLCIASRYPFTVDRTISRDLFKGYGNFAAFYRVSLANSELTLANVHFETPRPALESLLRLHPDSRAMQLRQQDRALQATIISEWAQSSSGSLIIAGDFNMPISSPIYRQYFSTMDNALSEKSPRWLNYTKYTRWHGIRIDHQLYQGGVQPVRADVLNLRSADHRPVLVGWRK